MKKVFLTITLFLITNAHLFAQVDPNARKTVNNVWGYIQLAAIFLCVVYTFVGALIVYQKKSASQPEEFKKSVMNFLYGLVFLLFALGMVSVIKSSITSATNVTF